VVLAGLCQRYWDQLYPLADEDGQEQRIGNLAWIAARVTQLVPTLPPDGAAACLDAVSTLERIIDVRLGADAPSFSAARAALAALVGPPLRACAAPPAPAPDNPAGSRAEALAQLRSVAEFFRRTEPHSPVAYLADKAARWGEQPLHVWLRGVVQDDAVYGQLEQLLGVGGKG
jgi:type VI secretion system protein ImpA